MQISRSPPQTAVTAMNSGLFTTLDSTVFSGVAVVAFEKLKCLSITERYNNLLS